MTMVSERATLQRAVEMAWRSAGREPFVEDTPRTGIDERSVLSKMLLR
jgi:hypothetical protein